MNNKYLLEVCVDSVESALIATRAGASRLELCSNLIIGGTTPTLPFFTEVRKQCDNIIHVLIRPRFGDFCYSEYEYAVVLEEVRQFKEAGADGVVIGILKEDGRMDIGRMEQLQAAAGPMSITLHRAFDVCSNPLETLEEAKKLGIHTILTSGQKNTCLDGIPLLRELAERADGKIDILAGSGIDGTAIKKIYRETAITSYHMSGKQIMNGRMAYRKADVHMGLDTFSEYDIWQTDGDKIKAAVTSLSQCLGTLL